MKNLIHYLAMAVAITISCVSAFYSVVGLQAIFSGAAYSILIMGGALELGKVVTASWIYRNWKIAPWFLKTYLTTAVVVLMAITSMGNFGYLSKAHLDQVSTTSSPTLQIQAIQTQIDAERHLVQNDQRALDELDKIVDTAPAKQVVYIRSKQASERSQLNQEISQDEHNIVDLTNKQLPLQQQDAKATADVGPLKYVADLIYGEEYSSQHLDQAVRIVTIVIISVFDPLAICLLIAANIGLSSDKEEVKVIEKIEPEAPATDETDWVSKLKSRRKKGVIEIDQSSIKTM
jgi:hypothetical protein